MKSVFVCAVSVVLLASSVAWGTITINSNVRIDREYTELISVVDGPSPPTVVEVVSPARTSDLYTYGVSRLYIFGGNIGSSLRAFDESEIHIFGGDPVASGEDITVEGTARVVIWGGVIGTGSDAIIARDHGHVEIRGGILRKALFAIDSGTIDVYGTGLTISPESSPNSYFLEGALADGSRVANSVLLFDSSSRITLHEVPEPEPMSMLVSVLVGLLVLRSQSRCQRPSLWHEIYTKKKPLLRNFETQNASF